MMINTCLKADSKIHNNEDPTARNIPLGKLYQTNFADNYASNASKQKLVLNNGAVKDTESDQARNEPKVKAQIQ